MRKSFLVLVALFPILLFAQKGFHIGASGTFSSTFIYTQNNYGTLAPFTKGVVRVSEMNYKLTWGGSGGVVLGYNFEPWVGLQAEVQYNTTGQKYEDNFIGPAVLPNIGTFGSDVERVNVTRNIRLSYVRIPILLKFTTNKGHVAKFYGALGPQIGIRTSAKEKVTIAGYDYDALAFTSDQKFQRMDFSIALQLGTEIYATDHLYFNIGISGFVGLLDINGKVLKQLDWYSKNDVSYKKSFNANAGLTIGVHYIIGEGRIDY
jgi:hypothetical protein